MDKFQLKGLFYNCDDKYFLWHNCREHNIFMAIYEDVIDEEAEVSPIEEILPTDDPTSTSDLLEFEPLISQHALTSFFAPYSLNLIGYIKL
jgi:hypothetical protein